jgi:hypothetical protein
LIRPSSPPAKRPGDYTIEAKVFKEHGDKANAIVSPSSQRGRPELVVTEDRAVASSRCPKR